MRKNNKTRKIINKKRGGRVKLPPKNTLSDNNNNDDDDEYNLNFQNLTFDDNESDSESNSESNSESDEESVDELDWYTSTVNSLFRFEMHSITMRTRLIFDSQLFNRLDQTNELQPILQFYLESLLRILNDPQERGSIFRDTIIDRTRLIINTELPNELNENARGLLLNLKALLIAALENLRIPTRGGGEKRVRFDDKDDGNKLDNTKGKIIRKSNIKKLLPDKSNPNPTIKSKLKKGEVLKAFDSNEFVEKPESIELPDIFIENLNKTMSNDKGTVNYNIDDLRRALNDDVYGVEMRVYPKPDKTRPLGLFSTEPEEKYLGRIDYKIIGNPNPIAKIDEELRQLSLYTRNDVLPYYTKDMDKNPKKLNPKSFNQHVKKRMLLYAPNNKKIGNRKTKGGKKEKKRKKRKKIYKKKKN